MRSNGAPHAPFPSLFPRTSYHFEQGAYPPNAFPYVFIRLLVCFETSYESLQILHVSLRRTLLHSELYFCYLIMLIHVAALYSWGQSLEKQSGFKLMTIKACVQIPPLRKYCQEHYYARSLLHVYKGISTYLPKRRMAGPLTVSIF